MKTSRLVVFILLVAGIVTFFMMQAQLDDNSRWAFVGVILLLAIIWVYLGDAPANKKPAARTIVNKQVSADISPEPSVDIPEIVVEDSMDGASLRERKMAKVAASREEEASNDIVVEPDDDLEEVVVTVEEVHVANEFVVEVSPQSIEDANITAHIQEKRDRHSRIRARIEERRRDQMAEIRASTAKMWEEHSSGEDLVGLIQSDDHGHNILVEPANAEAGHVYGASLVRIDESTILKLRVPLDEGFVAVEEDRTTTATLPLPAGLPSPEELGLPLPPPPGASGALAALKDEMANDD